MISLTSAFMIAGGLVLVGIAYKCGAVTYLKGLLAKAPAAPAAPGAPTAPAPAHVPTSGIIPSIEAILNSATVEQLAKMLPLDKIEKIRSIRSLNDQTEAIQTQNLQMKATIHQALGNVFKLTDVATAPAAAPAPVAPAPAPVA